jgi:3',5'-cyclic-AMP phosphodiesterase
MRLTWLSDIHLNFLRPGELEPFFAAVRAENPDAILLTGEIGEADNVVRYLERMDAELERPIFFVLGNHDFYRGSLFGVRQVVIELMERRPNLKYLTALDVIELTSKFGLVGDDGWADARLGDYEKSYVMMNDYRLIAELAPLSKQDRGPKLRELGDAAAEHVRRVLPVALGRYPHVLLATHLPPFKEACWHEGQISDNEWLPHFTCKAMGDAILEIMRLRPEKQLTIYCGHTHSSGICQPLPNVVVHTGGAKYGEPKVQAIIDLD